MAVAAAAFTGDYPTAAYEGLTDGADRLVSVTLPAWTRSISLRAPGSAVYLTATGTDDQAVGAHVVLLEAPGGGSAVPLAVTRGMARRPKTSPVYIGSATKAQPFVVVASAHPVAAMGGGGSGAGDAPSAVAQYTTDGQWAAAPATATASLTWLRRIAYQLGLLTGTDPEALPQGDDDME